MDRGESNSGGFLSLLRRIGDSILALLQNRLELVALELYEERVRLISLLLRVLLLLVLGTIALLSATALVVVIFWDSRIVALVILTVLYGLAALAMLWDVRKRLTAGPPPFADTLAEFRKDAQCLRQKE